MTEYPGKLWKDYELIDSGDGEKLERFGGYCIIRPEPKALWNKSMSLGRWGRIAHTKFRPVPGLEKLARRIAEHGKVEKTDDQWYIEYPGASDGLKFSLRLGLTSFKHVGCSRSRPRIGSIFSGIPRN